MTKRLFIILISVLICKIGFTQSRLSYTFDFEPIYSFRDYKVNDYNKETDVYPSGKLIFDNFENYYNEIEKPGFGFGLSLGINYKLTDKSSFKSGFGYKNIREKLELTLPIARYEISGIIIPVYSSDNEVTKQFNSYHYLTIPIDFQYKLFTMDKMSLGFIVGSDFDLLIGNKLTNHTDSYQTDPKYEFSKISKIAINIKGGLILDYKIQENLSIYIQPEFARYITPNIQYDLQSYDDIYCKINQYNYYGQIRIGIKYNK